MFFKQWAHLNRAIKGESIVYVQSDIQIGFQRDLCGSLRILHENHCTCRSYSTGVETVQTVICGCPISSPIIGIDDQHVSSNIPGNIYYSYYLFTSYVMGTIHHEKSCCIFFLESRRKNLGQNSLQPLHLFSSAKDHEFIRNRPLYLT